jgi:hypothetical protein
MKRRSFLYTSAGASIVTLVGCKTTQQDKKKKINILFIMDDQHRGDCIGAAGADWLMTPNLDRLANEGAMFTRAYTSMPSCLPARAAILTGLRPWNRALPSSQRSLGPQARESATIFALQ